MPVVALQLITPTLASLLFTFAIKSQSHCEFGLCEMLIGIKNIPDSNQISLVSNVLTSPILQVSLFGMELSRCIQTLFSISLYRFTSFDVAS